MRDVKLLKRSTPEFDDYAFNAATKRKFEPATKKMAFQPPDGLIPAHIQEIPVVKSPSRT